MSDGPKPRKTRRWLRRLLIIFAVFGSAVYFLFRDEELDPASDLMPQRPEIAWDDRNGWRLLAKAVRRMPRSSFGMRSQVPAGISHVRELDHAEVKRFALTGEELTELEAIAATPQFQSIIYRGDDIPDDSGTLYKLQPRFYFTLISATDEGDVPLVLRSLKLSLSLQKKLTGGATSISTYSRSALWIDDEAVARSLVRLDWSGPDLKELAGILADDPVVLKDLLEAMRQDFWLDERALLDPAGPPPLCPGCGPAGVPNIPGFLYQKNATVSLLAQAVREEMKVILVTPWSGVQSRQAAREAQNPVLAWLDPNRYGKALMGWFDPSRMDSSWRHRNGKRRAMRVIVALHRWQKVHGSLPAALDALVPDFLPAIPLDPFDFAPLRWHPAERAVQLTGSNGKLAAPDPKQVELIYGSIILFRTKAEEDERRASLPPANPPKPKTPAVPAPAGGANK